MLDQPIRVLVAEPNTLFRQGLKELFRLRREVDVVAEAARGGEAVERTREHRPDVVLLDPEMPGLSVRGLEACRAIKRELPEIPILLLGSSRDLEFILTCLRAGAAGYCIKDVPVEQLVACLERARTEGGQGAPFLGEIGDRSEEDAEAATLSQRERQILGLVAQGRSNKEIARMLGISEHTVRNHISNIFSKLRTKDRTDAAIQGMRRGLI